MEKGQVCALNINQRHKQLYFFKYLLLCWIYNDATWAMTCLKQRSLTCLFDSFFRRTMNYTWNLRITGAMWGDSSVVIGGRWTPQIARFMGPTLGPPGAVRTQVAPMLGPLGPLTLLSGSAFPRHRVIMDYIISVSSHWTIKFFN